MNTSVNYWCILSSFYLVDFGLCSLHAHMQLAPATHVGFF